MMIEGGTVWLQPEDAMEIMRHDLDLLPSTEFAELAALESGLVSSPGVQVAQSQDLGPVEFKVRRRHVTPRITRL